MSYGSFLLYVIERDEVPGKSWTASVKKSQLEEDDPASAASD